LGQRSKEVGKEGRQEEGKEEVPSTQPLTNQRSSSPAESSSPV
jgi:hypothetical protein